MIYFKADGFGHWKIDALEMVVPNENKGNDNRRRWRKKEERGTYSSSVITSGFVLFS